MQNNKKENRRSAVDFAKYFASLMIVAIHTGLFSDIHENTYFVVVNIICRAAVPFFAVCSGYFLARHLDFGKTLKKTAQNQTVFLLQWKKLIYLYSIWTVLYLFYSIPMWIKIGWFSLFSFVDYAMGAITQGSHYHFWYLWGMIYTLPVFYLVLQTTSRKIWITIAAVLWAIKVLTYAYSPWLPSFTIGLLPILEKAGTFLCLLPLLLLGAVIATGRELKPFFCALSFTFSVLGLFTEAFTLKHSGQELVSYVFFTLPAAYFLFCLVLQIRLPRGIAAAKKFGTVSVFVYCVHPMFVEKLNCVLSNSIFHFFVVSICSTLLGFVWMQVKKQIDRKKVTSCFS